jgi:PAS domain S-box-containing protein
LGCGSWLTLGKTDAFQYRGTDCKKATHTLVRIYRASEFKSPWSTRVMTVLRTMWVKAAVLRIRAPRVFVLGTVLASLSLLALPRALAVDPDRRISQYGHTIWRVQDGAISPPTNIAQTTDGFLWITTAQGLMRFDGARFMQWQPTQGQNLSGTHFTAVFGSRDGSLWIGTTRGLARWKDGQLRSYTHPEHYTAIGEITEDDSGTIWATRYGLYAHEAPLCSISAETLRCFGKKDGIPVTYGLGLTHDSEGNIWFGSSVLVRWRPGTPATTYFGEIAKELAKGDGVDEVALGPSGTAWAGLDGTGPQLGVRYYSGSKWTSYAVPGFDGARVRSHALLVDRRGSLWVGTRNDGLYRISGGVADHYGASDGLSGNSVGSLFEDREGNIWVITDGGLDMFRDTVLISYTTRQGVSNSDFHSVMALRNGAVLIGTADALNILRKQDGKPAIFDRKLSGKGVGPGTLEDHSGVIWLGVDLALMRFQNGRFREIGGQRFAGVGGVSSIAEDSGGTIWVLNGRGYQILSIVGNKIKKQVSLNDELGRPQYLVADPNGGLWIGTGSGKSTVSYFRDGRLQTTSLSSPQGPVGIHALFVDSDNSLLVTLFSSENGLPCPETFSAIRDNHGALWIYTRCGLIRIAESEWAKWIENPHAAVSVMTLDAPDGAQAGTGSIKQPAASKGPDGRLWFVTGVSVQVLDPDHLYENALPPPVYVEGVVADHKRFDATSFVKVPALSRDLEVDYTAPSLSVPQKVRFRYMLEGRDREWQDAGTRRQAFYTDLKPRHYRFRVTACNGNGVWNQTGASLDFVVLPAYYQTNWFRFFCVAAFIALLWALHRWRVHRLKSQERRLRDVVETIPTMTFTALSDGSSTFVNQRWTEYTGLSVEQSSGAGWQCAIHPEDLVHHSEKWRISVATGQLFEDEARFRRAADGEYRWFLVRGVPLRDQHGNTVKWYGTLTDIEDSKRAGEALRRSELYLREGQRLAHTGSWAFNSAGFDYWSSELFHVYGLDPGGKPPTIKEYLNLVHPEDRNFMEQEMQEMLANHCEFDFTKRIVRPDGNIRYVRCVGVPVTEGVTFQGFAGTGMDVTEQELLEQERERIRQLETELAHTNRVSMLGEMAASLAHEIKQPIAAAITSANSCIEWLAHEPPNLDRARAAAARIDKYGNRAAEIIDHIRSLYKKSPPQRELVDVNGIIQEMLTLLEGEADRYSIAMHTDLSAELRKIMADPVQLQQVFMNLMLNAIEAMTDLGGELTVKSEIQDGQLQFSVSDAGVGLPLEKMDQIFSAFFTTKPQGSGMGLAISRSIVESHGGRLWATANDGRGATFYFTLPIQATESSPST